MNAPFQHRLKPGTAASDAEALDALAQAERPERAFLRAAWFLSGPEPATKIAIARDMRGHPLAAFPLRKKPIGPSQLGIGLNQIAGPYWPMRGAALDASTPVEALGKALTSPLLARTLGPAFRLGPALESDPSLNTLREAAAFANWSVLSRPVSDLYALDLAALSASGEWPSSKGQQKDRWRVRQLEKTGPVRIDAFTGLDWTQHTRDAIAAVEAHSWVGQLEEGGDTKFSDPAMRKTWEEMSRDPALAAMINGRILWVGRIPAAFTFGLDCGDTRYCIANNFDQRFSKHSPGRVLLYDDFTAAAARGIKWLDWGLGDAGYKQPMGAHNAGAFVDLLFVRNSLVARALRPLWER